VMKYIPDSENGTQEEKDMAMAEARVNRAYYYWFLNQTYSKAYDKTTANTDLSVPLMLEPDLEAKPVRATQSAVIAQILQDLEGVAKHLAVEQTNRYRVTQGAAYGLLARVYLYLGEFEKAAAEASKALELNNKLLDYRTFSFKNPARPSQGVNNKPDFIYSPEVLFFRSNTSTMINTAFGLSPEMEQIYNEYPNDLRMKFNYSLLDRQGKPVPDGLRRCLFNVDYTLGVPEMMLIIAENYARKGDTKALDVLNDLRKTRFLEEDYTPLTGTTKEQLLNHVIKERRRELHMHGLRWFDMKRLAKEGLYTTTIVRTVQGVEHKLEPNSNRYLFPLAPSLLNMNPKLEQNPR
jgi:starch-binding outer membrane protein, SusD/RagB family